MNIAGPLPGNRGLQSKLGQTTGLLPERRVDLECRLALNLRQPDLAEARAPTGSTRLCVPVLSHEPRRHFDKLSEARVARGRMA